MSWGSFLLVGDMGQQLDLGEQAEELGRLRRSLARRRTKDLDQDAEIASLARENLNLKLGLAALVRLLAARGVVQAGEIADLVSVLDRSDRSPALTATETDGPPPAEDEAASGANPTTAPRLRLVGSDAVDDPAHAVRRSRRGLPGIRVSKVPESLAAAGGRP